MELDNLKALIKKAYDGEYALTSDKNSKFKVNIQPKDSDFISNSDNEIVALEVAGGMLFLPKLKAIDPVRGKPGEYFKGPLSESKYESDVYRAVARLEQLNGFSRVDDKLPLTPEALEGAIRQAAAAFKEFETNRPKDYTAIRPRCGAKEPDRVEALLKTLDEGGVDMATMKAALAKGFSEFTGFVASKQYAWVRPSDSFVNFLMNELQRFDLAPLVGANNRNMISSGLDFASDYNKDDRNHAKARSNFITAFAADLTPAVTAVSTMASQVTPTKVVAHSHSHRDDLKENIPSNPNKREALGVSK